VKPLQPSGIGAALRIPDYPEPITGYRAWSLGEIDGAAYLTSLTHLAIPWPVDGPLVAEHVGDTRWLAMNIYHLAETSGDLRPAVAPVKGCECGIYAYMRRESIYNETYYIPGKAKLIGEVKLWGKMWEHEGGWRAMFAQPVALYSFSWGGVNQAAIEVVAARYGVPVIGDPFERGALVEPNRTSLR